MRRNKEREKRKSIIVISHEKQLKYGEEPLFSVIVARGGSITGPSGEVMAIGRGVVGLGQEKRKIGQVIKMINAFCPNCGLRYYNMDLDFLDNDPGCGLCAQAQVRPRELYRLQLLPPWIIENDVTKEDIG